MIYVYAKCALQEGSKTLAVTLAALAFFTLS